MVPAQGDDGRRLLSFNGPIKIHQRRSAEGQLEYVVTPLDDAAVLEALCEARTREAFYAGVDAALREAERLSVEQHPLELGRLRAALVAVRHPRERHDG